MVEGAVVDLSEVGNERDGVAIGKCHVAGIGALLFERPCCGLVAFTFTFIFGYCLSRCCVTFGCGRCCFVRIATVVIVSTCGRDKRERKEDAQYEQESLTHGSPPRDLGASASRRNA
ncbi:MAG: hypothetical protein IH940_05250 [Acidobacteria bacterium]|nr:hypothetical protein [Acidobacteriota bacterium]